MYNNIITPEINNVLDKLCINVVDQLWTLNCKNGEFKLEIKWSGQTPAILSKPNTTSTRSKHTALSDVAPISNKAKKHKSPSKIRRDKARLELWKSRQQKAPTGTDTNTNIPVHTSPACQPPSVISTGPHTSDYHTLVPTSVLDISSYSAVLSVPGSPALAAAVAETVEATGSEHTPANSTPTSSAADPVTTPDLNLGNDLNHDLNHGNHLNLGNSARPTAVTITSPSAEHTASRLELSVISEAGESECMSMIEHSSIEIEPSIEFPNIGCGLTIYDRQPFHVGYYSTGSCTFCGLTKDSISPRLWEKQNYSPSDKNFYAKFPDIYPLSIVEYSLLPPDLDDQTLVALFDCRYIWFKQKCFAKLCQNSHSDLKNCTRCGAARYCSKECQKSDWKCHKAVCDKAWSSVVNGDAFDLFGCVKVDD